MARCRPFMTRDGALVRSTAILARIRQAEHKIRKAEHKLRKAEHGEGS